MKKLFVFMCAAVVGGLLLATPAVALETGNANAAGSAANPLQYKGDDGKIGTITSPVTGNPRTVTGLISRVIQYTLGVIAMVAIVVIILAGFRMIAGSGDEKQRTTAKRSITWAIIGLVLALLSFSIVTIIQSVLYKQL